MASADPAEQVAEVSNEGTSAATPAEAETEVGAGGGTGTGTAAGNNKLRVKVKKQYKYYYTLEEFSRLVSDVVENKVQV